MWVPSNTCKGSYSVHLAENPQLSLQSLWRYLAGSPCLPGKDSTGCFRKFHLAFSGLILSPWTLSFFLETGHELAWSLGARDCKIPPFLSSSRVTTFPGCTFLLQKGFRSYWNPSFNHFCMHAKSSLTLCDPMGCSLPGSSVRGIFQARILEWVAIYYSRRSSLPKGWIQVSCISCIGRQILYHCIKLGSPQSPLIKAKYYSRVNSALLIFLF